MSTEAVPGPEHRARWGPACGVAFVVFLAASFLITSTPNTNKSPAYIYAWYNNSSHQTHMKISLILADIAVVFGVYWFLYLRDRLGRTDIGARLAPAMLVGIAVLVTGGLIFSGTMLALFDKPKDMLPATAQTLNFLNSDIGALATVVAVSIIMVAAGMIILKTRILPVWLAWFSFLLAVVALAGPAGFFAFLAMGIWILIVAFLMWRREETLPVGSLPEDVSGGAQDGLPTNA
jgi:preprotein translocase subunit YajC